MDDVRFYARELAEEEMQVEAAGSLGEIEGNLTVASDSCPDDFHLYTTIQHRSLPGCPTAPSTHVPSERALQSLLEAVTRENPLRLTLRKTMLVLIGVKAAELAAADEHENSSPRAPHLSHDEAEHPKGERQELIEVSRQRIL
jgi:hypothetical protein